LTNSRWEEECLFKYTTLPVCCYVEISQYVAAIMFALIREPKELDRRGRPQQAAGGAQAERADETLLAGC
jgi:hypothetical protein